MAWTTPKTWTAATLTSSDMNAHVRDNENALRTAQKITTATKTTNTTFDTTSTTIASFSYTFDSGTTYLLTGSLYQATASAASSYYFDLQVKVGSTVYGAFRFKTDGTASGQTGMVCQGIVSGVSGSQTVYLSIAANGGSGHTATATSNAPAVLTLTPLDVV